MPAHHGTSQATRDVLITHVVGDQATRRLDSLAIEEPLEIRMAYGAEGDRHERSVSITMRTPGDDLELAVGFLHGEGLLTNLEAIDAIRPCGPEVDESGLRNVVRLELRPGHALDLARLERHFYTTSSCGVCGKSSIEALRVTELSPIPREGFMVDSRLIPQLPDRLREAQAVFERTGGLHAAALFAADGELLALYEDVGRHNAVDKLIGSQVFAHKLPRRDALLFVSGRASFELVQKALVAGIPMMAAVGAPSTLAVQLASEFDMTLLGFVRQGRFNIYSGDWRIRHAQTRSEHRVSGGDAP